MQLRSSVIDDCAKDSGKDFFAKMHCILNQIPIGSLGFIIQAQCMLVKIPDHHL